MKQLQIIPLICLLLFFNSLFAQESIIEGFIKDVHDNPLPGVSVFIKNSSLGASSNGNGYYALERAPAGKQFLVFSCIGYITQEIEIEIAQGGKIESSISLEESISELNELTVISGGIKGLQEIPGSVQYLSPKDLDQFNYTDINRALKSVPGVNMQEEDGFGLRPNIGLRATGVERSSKITLMEDGILMAPAPYVAPAAYYFPTMGRMQGIEIMKGNSQIKYGPYTTGGALNLISTQIPNRLAGNIDMLFGSYGSNSLHANVGNSHEQVGYMIETFQYGSDGFKELDGGGNTGFDKADYLGKISLNTKESAKIFQSIMMKYGNVSENSQETYLGLTDDDFKQNFVRRYSGSQVDEMISNQQQISLNHTARFNTWKLSTSIYKTEFERNWYKLDKVIDSSDNSISISDILENPDKFERAFDIIKGSSSQSNEALIVKANNRSYYAKGLQTNLHYSFVSGSVDHKIDLGARIHEDQVDRFQWVDAYSMDNGIMKLVEKGQPGTESNRIETAKAFATYIQYSLNVNKITLTPGMRYEHIRLTKLDYGKNDVYRVGLELVESNNRVEVFLPGIGADYKFNRYASIFAGYHKGFAPPGTKEGTKPELSNNYELGYRRIKNTLNFQTTFFFNDYENLLGVDLNASGGTGSNDLYNGGAAQSMGAEISAGYDLMAYNKITKWSLPVQISYTYTDAHFLSSFESDFEGWGAVEEGDQIPYLANHQFSIVAGIQYQSWSFHVNWRYMDAMRTEPGQGPMEADKKTDAYAVTDLSLQYHFKKVLSLFSNLTNLTNGQYIVARRPAGVRPGMPRAINAGIKASF